MWTARDERRLQSAIESVAFWRASLEASLNATSLREGDQSRVERRKLIARGERQIAKLSAEKRDACPGHVASAHDAKVCDRCGIHINSLRTEAA